jgi:hypothetical protein
MESFPAAESQPQIESEAQLESESRGESDSRGGPMVVPGRDPDLVALEGFESEFADLEIELERVERASGDRETTPPAG